MQCLRSGPDLVTAALFECSNAVSAAPQQTQVNLDSQHATPCQPGAMPHRGIDTSQSSSHHFAALYTKHLIQKRKIWLEGQVVVIQHLWKQARNRQARLLDSSGHVLNEITLPASVEISEGSEGLTVFEGWLVNVEAGSPRAAADSGASAAELPGPKRARRSVPVLRQRFAVPRQESPLLVPAVSQHDQPQQHGTMGRAEPSPEAPLVSAQRSAGPGVSTAWPGRDAGQIQVSACRPQPLPLANRPVGELEPAAGPLPIWQPQVAALHQSCGSSAVLESGCRPSGTAAGAASALRSGDSCFLNSSLSCDLQSADAQGHLESRRPLVESDLWSCACSLDWQQA